jgi:hypothetical protein
VGRGRCINLAAEGTLDRRLCQVVGLNLNHTSDSGTPYHLQIEDRGPVIDPVTESEVRRVNVIVYVNYGEPNARIIHGRDHDFPDLRTAEHNRFVAEQIQVLAGRLGGVVDGWEARQVERIQGLLRQYYTSKQEAAKREIEDANRLYPFLFSKAWRQLKEERTRQAEAPPAAPPPAIPVEVQYPLDQELRDRVVGIERLIHDLEADLEKLKQRGSADDILLQTCRKLVTRARDILTGNAPAEFTVRRLDSTRGSLITTWRQIKSRLRAS